jgi:2-keto-4-pentenoate hydratase/2-oxohepta-3-ene-1,7-dioic acid hydratase in catechol pathway
MDSISNGVKAGRSMKLVRFQVPGRTAYGILHGKEVAELAGDCFGDLSTIATSHALSSVKLLAPCSPSKVIAVGLNYRDHARELELPVPDVPVIFLKPPTTIIGPGDAILYPEMSSQVDFEAELGIVIKDQTKNIRPEEAGRHILGFTCANDITARDLQKKDGQWTRAKSFDTFCPIGPWIETGLDPDDVRVESYLNGEQRQASRTSQFIFKIDFLVSFISYIMTLYPGDLIITGTPAGIGPMKSGDEIEVRIEGIGSLKNVVN